MATREKLLELRQYLHAWGDRSQVQLVDEVVAEHYPKPGEEMSQPELIGPTYGDTVTAEAGDHWHWVLGSFHKGDKTKELDGVYLIREDGTILGAGVNVSDGPMALYCRVARPSKP